MSASDEKMIDDAITMANEFAAHSRAQLLRQESLSSAASDRPQSDSDSDSESPKLISKLKASIKGRSPRQERKRTFSDSLNFDRETNADVPPEAQEAYNMLVVHGSVKDGSRQYQRQGVGDLTTNRESLSSIGSVGHNFAYADSSSSVSRTPDRVSPPKSVSRSSSERMSVSPPNLARIDCTGDKQFEPKPVPLPRPESSLKRSEIPIPKPRPEILRVEPTPRPPPPPPPEAKSQSPSLNDDTSNNAFDNPLLINENDWRQSEDSLKGDQNSQVEILRVDLPDEKDTASKSSLSLDSGGKSTPSNESTDSKAKFFGDDFAEPSPREIMSKLARESRLRRSVDHQRGVFTDSETTANKNLREPQGIPGKLSVSVGDEDEVDTNPLRMLRGGVIPVRGGRAGSGIPSSSKPTLRHPKLHFNTSHSLQHSLSVDAGTDHVAVQSDDEELEEGAADESSTSGPPTLPPRSFSVCDSINPLPLPPRAPRRPGSLNQKPRQRMFPLVADNDNSGVSVATTTAHNSGGDLSVSSENAVENVLPTKHLPALDRISAACNPLHEADSSSYADLPLAPPPPVDQEPTCINELDDNVFEKSESPRLSKHLNLNLSSEGGTSGASTFPRGLKLFGLKRIPCNLEQLGFYNHQDPFWVKSVFTGDTRCRSDRSTSTDAEASPLMLANYKQRSDGVSYEDLLDFALDR